MSIETWGSRMEPDPRFAARRQGPSRLRIGRAGGGREAFMRAEAAKWGPVLKQANIKIQ